MHPATLFLQNWITPADTRADTRAGTLTHLALGGRVIEFGNFGAYHPDSACSLSCTRQKSMRPVLGATVNEVQHQE